MLQIGGLLLRCSGLAVVVEHCNVYWYRVQTHDMYLFCTEIDPCNREGVAPTGPTLPLATPKAGCPVTIIGL